MVTLRLSGALREKYANAKQSYDNALSAGQRPTKHAEFVEILIERALDVAASARPKRSSRRQRGDH